MEYLVAWEENGRKVWESAESRRDVSALLLKNGIENSTSVIIIKMEDDAEATIIASEDIFSSL